VYSREESPKNIPLRAFIKSVAKEPDLFQGFHDIDETSYKILRSGTKGTRVATLVKILERLRNIGEEVEQL
jgi:hypothetical protein